MARRNIKVTAQHLLRLVAAVCIVSVGAAAAARAADVQYPKGSHLGLVPPPGLQLDPGKPGFRDPDNNVTILLLELPPPAYQGIRGAMITSKAKEHGIIIDRRETLFTPAGALLLSAGEDTTHKARKWMLLGEMPGFTALVMVDIPDTAKSRYPDSAIYAALKTLSLRKVPIAEQLSLLPFKLTDLAGFRIVAVMGRSAVVLTAGGSDEIHDADQPHLLIGIGAARTVPSSDWPRLAELMFINVPGYTDKRITDSEMIRIDGTPAYEVRGEAKDAVTNSPVQMVQWLRFGAGALLQIIGVTTKANWSRDFPKFRAVRDGIKPNS